MKINKVLILLSIVICLTGCAKTTKEDFVDNQPDTTIISEETLYANRAKLAEALNQDMDYREIDFMLDALNTIHAGTIKEVFLDENINSLADKVLDITAEDGTHYHMGLSNSDSLEFVKNVDTGEFPIYSTQ